MLQTTAIDAAILPVCLRLALTVSVNGMSLTPPLRTRHTASNNKINNSTLDQIRSGIIFYETPLTQHQGRCPGLKHFWRSHDTTAAHESRFLYLSSMCILSSFVYLLSQGPCSSCQYVYSAQHAPFPINRVESGAQQTRRRSWLAS